MNQKLRCVFRTVALLLCSVVLLHSTAAAAPSVSAASALLMDAQTGRILYEQNPEQKSLVASTTKIMTGFVVAQSCDPNQEVTIMPEACGIEGSSLYLKPGEIWTIQDLLYGMMLHSGNDAAVALAIACSGSVPAFVERMNQQASRLGLQQTHFANPNGLDNDENYSTARDLATLTRAALENPLFAQVVATKSICVGGRCLTNHNKMLRLYQGADGVKTGYTKAAGRILVSSASRDGRQLIAVTIHAPNDWEDHKKLLDYGFEQFSPQTLVREGQLICALAVVGGEAVDCNLLADQTVTYPLAQSEKIHVKIQAPDFIYAPVCAGQQVGVAQICLGEHVIASCKLLAAADVAAVKSEKKSFWQRVFGE